MPPKLSKNVYQRPIRPWSSNRPSSQLTDQVGPAQTRLTPHEPGLTPHRPQRTDQVDPAPTRLTPHRPGLIPHRPQRTDQEALGSSNTLVEVGPTRRTVEERSKHPSPPVDGFGSSKDIPVTLESGSEDGDDQAEFIPHVNLASNLTLAQKLKGLKAVYPNVQDPDAVEVTADDLKRLQPEVFLNDTIIDLWLKQFIDDMTPQDKARFYFFNSFFFKKLKGKTMTSAEMHEGVKKWTKNVDIFEKDYLIVPIHDELHWSLALVCFPGGMGDPNRQSAILHLDSLKGMHHLAQIKPLLINYLDEEWKVKQKEKQKAGGPEADGSSETAEEPRLDPFAKGEMTSASKTVEVPQQTNTFDCGLFLLKFVQHALYSAPSTMTKDAILQVSLDKSVAPKDCQPVEGLNKLPFLGKDWFEPRTANQLRDEIEEKIVRLFREQCWKKATVFQMETLDNYLKDKEDQKAMKMNHHEEQQAREEARRAQLPSTSGVHLIVD